MPPTPATRPPWRKAWEKGRRNPAIAAEIDRFEQAVELRLGRDGTAGAIQSVREGTPFIPPGFKPEHREALSQVAQQFSAAWLGRFEHRQQLHHDAWERTLRERQHERGWDLGWER
jgi:hypothetical protein